MYREVYKLTRQLGSNDDMTNLSLILDLVDNLMGEIGNSIGNTKKGHLSKAWGRLGGCLSKYVMYAATWTQLKLACKGRR